MNYQKHYDLLIERARNRAPVGFIEVHHIIPVCLGGSDNIDNLVSLTPEEHYVAHQLLVKIYPGNRPIIYAALMMGNTRPNNKSYGWIKRQLSLLGHTEEHKRKIGKSHIGKKRAPFSEEWKRKISESCKGKKITEETRARMSAAQKGRTFSPGTLEKMSATRKGRPSRNKGIPMSDETKKKLSESQRARLAKKKLDDAVE